MDIFIYIMIFIGGTVFGSFFSLAVYRIPRKENITYVQSHCVSCNHKLYLKDLIPILSYIFLGGKCRYCKEKIRSRYILLEIASGIVFLLIAFSMRISIYSTFIELINLFIIYLFICAVFLIGGIDKENHMIPNCLLVYSIVIACIRVLMDYVINVSVINSLIGFLVIPFVLFIVNLMCKLSKNKMEFVKVEYIKYLAIIGFFIGVGAQIIIAILSLLILGVECLLHKNNRIPLGYYISIATVVVVICSSQLDGLIKLVSI